MVRRRSGPSEADEPSMSESDGIRYLHFCTEWVQGAMRVSKPAELVLTYTAQMMAWLLFLAPRQDDTVAVLGLGAGSLTRFCLKHMTGEVVTVEWNPRVTAICQMYFRLPGLDRAPVVHADAAEWVADPVQTGRACAMMVDLYDAHARGPVRDSVVFYRDCRRVLTEEAGVLTVNLFGNHESFPRNIDNLHQAFAGRVVVLPAIDEGNQIAIAFTGPPLVLTVKMLLIRAEIVQACYGVPALRWARSLLGHATGEGVLHF
jgi:spermidine synthase